MIQKQEHEMCKTNMKKYVYYANIYEHGHEKNMIRLWCKIMFKTNVEHIKRNEGSYFYLYSFEDLAQGSFQRGFYVCIKYKNFLRTFLTKSQLWINLNLTKS